MKQKISMTFVIFIVMLFLLSTVASAVGRYDPKEKYSTKCGVCGYDNPQWLEEDSVHYCRNCGALGMPALIDDSGPKNTGNTDNWDYNNVPRDTGDDEGRFPIEVVIGGGAAIGAAVTVILKKAKKGRVAPQKADRITSPEGRGENKQDQDQPEGYILNISEDNIFITPETSAQLIVTVLRVFADGNTQKDPSAPITVSLEPNSNLQVVPLKGFGEISVSISQKNAESMNIEEYINVTTLVPGSQKTAKVKVSAAPAVQMVFF